MSLQPFAAQQAHFLEERARLTPPPPDAAPAVRRPDGTYPATEQGKVAADGSLLDRVLEDARGGYAYALAWTEPQCALCWRPEVRHMLPPLYRAERCHEHPHRPEPAHDPFPFSAHERAAAEARAWAPIAQRLGIPVRFHEYSFATCRATAPIRTVRRFLEDGAGGGQCLGLLGPPGVGKTVGMIAGVRHQAVWERVDLEYVTMPALVRQLIGADSETIFDRVRTVPLLALDDVGAAYVKSNGAVESRIEELFCEREAHQRTTMFTTNMTPRQLDDALGERVADRLRGPWGVLHSIPGASLRRARPASAA